MRRAAKLGKEHSDEGAKKGMGGGCPKPKYSVLGEYVGVSQFNFDTGGISALRNPINHQMLVNG